MLNKVISFQQHKSLSILQFSTKQQDTFDYISGPHAMTENLIEVKEVNQAGSVNHLAVFNLSEKYVFFMDGDILTGAKQNRVLNTSVLLAPNTKTDMPVSCVEQGRWSKISDKFSSTEYISPAALRAKKSKNVSINLNESRGHSGNQGDVWDSVASYATAFKIQSPTSNLSDVYFDKKSEFEEYTKQFTINPEANGIAVFVNKTLLNIEVFNRKNIFADYFLKLLRGTAMEAFRIKPSKEKLPEQEANYKMLTFLDGLEEIPMNVHKGVGTGHEKRFETSKMTGFRLEFNEHLIHLTALNLGQEIK